MTRTPTPLEMEGAHEPSTEKSWQESWYFNFFDRKAGLFGLARIGAAPNRNKADGLFLLAAGGAPAILYPALGKRLDRPEVDLNPPGILRTGGLVFSCREPLARWDMALLTRRVKVELEFESITPAYDYPEPSAGPGKSAASSHYEQACRITGRIQNGNQAWKVDALGQRDHSWGPRDWSGVKTWTWISAQFESGWAFNFWTVGGKIQKPSCGFVGFADRCVDLVDGSVTWTGDPSGKKPDGAKIILKLSTGEIREVDFSALGSWPLYKAGAVINETFGGFYCKGESGGGVCEHLYTSPFGPLPLMRHVPRMAYLGMFSR